ncbi:uncharacterized protein LOC111871602 [Cryptotermes secundus]|uniref:uncharacterized protein LOC111871602 n=1 Tax=Cryptotermes secundus TaxID=105785 RepID=UPI000CD7D075|nr:uncharacterized protein LOC111871602 [Cryptotermes secundus]XP_023720590.1 uncharacterized protein LOC111871602 [Cryptotermes secundus]XP_033610206.1 uncharacterized protein LOC111871602 [Cryptotermes secundus]
MVLIPPGLFLLLSCWHGVQPMSVSKMARSYVTTNMNFGYVRQNNMFGIFGGIVPCERGTCTSRQYCDQSGGESIGYCIEPQMSSRGVCCSCKYASCSGMVHIIHITLISLYYLMHVILSNNCHMLDLHLGHCLQSAFNRNKELNCTLSVQSISEPKFLKV